MNKPFFWFIEFYLIHSISKSQQKKIEIPENIKKILSYQPSDLTEEQTEQITKFCETQYNQLAEADIVAEIKKLGGDYNDDNWQDKISCQPEKIYKMAVECGATGIAVVNSPEPMTASQIDSECRKLAEDTGKKKGGRNIPEDEKKPIPEVLNQLGIKFKRDFATEQIYIKYPEKDWTPYNESQVAQLFTKLHTLKGVKWGFNERVIAQVVRAVADQNLFDSVIDILNNCKEKAEPGRDYISELVTSRIRYDYEDLETIEFIKSLVHKKFIMAVASMINLPDSQETQGLVESLGVLKDCRTIDETILLFVGGQNAGKSRFLEALLKPFANNSYNMGLADSDYHKKDASGKAAIVLCEELDLSTRQANSSFKKLLSERTIETVKKYVRDTQKTNRRYSAFGSTNVVDAVSDLTGSRRFLIVNLPQETDEKTGELVPGFLDFAEFKNIDYSPVWGQAVRELEQGAKPYLTPEEIAKLQRINRDRNTPVTFIKARLQEITGEGEETEEENYRYHNFETLDQILCFLLKSVEMKLDLRNYAGQLAELKQIIKEGKYIQKIRNQVSGCRKVRYQIAEKLGEEETEEQKQKTDEKLVKSITGKEFKTKKDLYQTVAKIYEKKVETKEIKQKIGELFEIKEIRGKQRSYRAERKE